MIADKAFLSGDVGMESSQPSSFDGGKRANPLIQSSTQSPMDMGPVGFEPKAHTPPPFRGADLGTESGLTLNPETLAKNPKKSEELPELPRGVRPDILLSQIKNTAPFLFEPGSIFVSRAPGLRYLENLFQADRLIFESSLATGTPSWNPTHFEYFELCLSAHWATVGSFVPTDVDNQIRFRLWHPTLSVDEIAEMANLVLEAYRWDTSHVSKRFVTTPSGEVLSGHHGEWFSVAVAAYGATRKRDPQKAQEMLDAIQYEVTREAKVFLELKRVRDGMGMLKASTLIAHNLGDLDRVIDLWGLKEGDPLYDFAYKAGNSEGARALRFSGALSEAGRLNKAQMAPENHRHLPLRAPKGLRRTEDFLLPVAPFFDQWGAKLAKHPELTPEELAEVVETLYQGWERLKGPDGKTLTYAYPRAVAGILENYPGGMNKLGALLPSKVERNLRSGLFRSLVSISERRFEEQWAQMALNFTK